MTRIFIIIVLCSIVGIVLYYLLSNNIQNQQTPIGSSQENSSSGITKITYKDISPKEAKENLNTDNSIILLDVRTIEEYNESHIPNSLLIPLDSIAVAAEEKISNKDTTLYVYCRSGRRSVSASKILIELGYKNVYNLGGIIDWPYETE